MQINQFIANSLKQGFSLVMCFMAFTLSAQEEETLSFGVGEGTITEGPSMDGIALPFDFAEIVIKDGLYGFENNDSIFDLGVYQRIEDFTDNTYLIYKAGKYGLANEQGVLFVDPIYDSIRMDSYYFSSAFYVEKKNKHGALNDSGAVILPLNYSHLHYANNVSKLFLAEDKSGRISLLSGIKPKKIEVDGAVFYENLAIFKRDGKFGVIHDGKITVPSIYDSIYSETISKSPSAIEAAPHFKNGGYSTITELIIIKDGKKGIIKPNDEVVFPAQFDLIKYSRKKYYLVKKGDKVGAYVVKNDFKIPVEFEHITPQLAGCFTVTKDGKHGLIKLSGEAVFPCEYDKIKPYYYDQIMVTKQGKQGLYDKDGKEILPIKYDEIDRLRKDPDLTTYYLVKENGRAGIITPASTIVPIKFDHVYERNDFFIVTLADLVGLYNLKGEEFLPPSYNQIYHTVNKGTNIMVAEKDGKLGIIDRQGNQHLMGGLNAIHYIRNSENLNSPSTPNKSESFLRVQNEMGKWGVFDEFNPALITPIVYDRIVQKLDLTKSSYFIVEKDKKMGVINSKNEMLIPIKYDELNFNFMRPPFTDTQAEVKIVAKLKKNYGLIDLKENILVPFEYNCLAKISFSGLYKAKKKSGYSIINSKNEVILEGPLCQVGDFDNGIALIFKEDKMRVINENCQIIAEAKPMTYHKGFRSFQALKNDLVNCLNSKEDADLMDFAIKISPSEHILFLFSKLTRTYAYLEYLSPSTISKRYYEVLLQIKRQWNKSNYDHNKLIGVEDYTIFEGRVFTNQRTEEPTFGMRELEWILRDAVRMDGFWISTFFLKHRFK